jgi:hypothetical protein
MYGAEVRRQSRVTPQKKPRHAFALKDLKTDQAHATGSTFFENRNVPRFSKMVEFRKGDTWLPLARKGHQGRRKRESYLEHFVDISGAKDFVDVGKLLGLIGREVGREHTVASTSPAKQLARSARRHPRPHLREHGFLSCPSPRRFALQR